MALHLDLMVNGQRLGQLVAQRLGPVSPTDDDVCRYSWYVVTDRGAGPKVDGVSDPDAPLEHRYGDGAWALVAKVLDAALGRQEPADDAVQAVLDAARAYATWWHSHPVTGRRYAGGAGPTAQPVADLLAAVHNLDRQEATDRA